MLASATSNPVGSKVGTSSSTCYLGVICLDQTLTFVCSTFCGNLQDLLWTIKNLLNLIVTHECIVTGE